MSKQILNELSFAASNASIYILVNAVEMEMCSENESCSDGFKLYNTNLVFDRNGCIVSRYRKFNLFHEPLMNVTEQPELSTFEADFGVNFGHFICFDILFKSPAIELIRTNISHILYPSNWFSETPFLTSIQIQQSFAQGNNIALLSSGTNSPSKSSTGSGIFIGRYGAVEKIISYKNETRMLIAEVPKNIDDSEYMPPSPSALSYPKDEMEALHLRSFSPTNTSSLHESSKIQLEDASCEFSLNFTRLEIPEGSVGYGYRLVAFSGTRSYFGIINAGEIHCAIVSCLDENDEKSCGKRFKNSENLIASVIFHAINIKLSINAEAEDYLVMPTSLNTSIVPLTADQYHFESHITAKDQNYKIESTVEIESLMSFGIYGRNFNRDGKNCEKNKEMEPVDESDFDDDEEEDIDGYFTKSDADDNDLRLKMTIYIVLMVVLSIVTSIMVYRKLQHPYVKPNSNKRKSVV